MAPQSLETPRDHSTNGSAVSDSRQRIDGHSAIADMSPVHHHDHAERLLSTDLEQYRGNAEKLYDLSVDLQKLGTAQKAEIQRLQAERTSNLINIPSKRTSRRRTEETDSSRATTMSDNHEETVLVFSPSDNRLTVRQRRSMKDTDYLRADLPPFHWWSDRIHIYFEKTSSPDASSKGQPQVVVVKDEIEESSKRDVTLIRTVKLTQLGFGISLRRIFGQIKVIYVLSPRPQSAHVQEMAMHNINRGIQPFTKVKSVS
jgi:hypothetical protein